MRVGRQDLGEESNISDVGSVAIDNQSIDKLIEHIKSSREIDRQGKRHDNHSH
jgi:hypothetical protein